MFREKERERERPERKRKKKKIKRARTSERKKRRKRKRGKDLVEGNKSCTTERRELKEQKKNNKNNAKKRAGRERVSAPRLHEEEECKRTRGVQNEQEIRESAVDIRLFF